MVGWFNTIPIGWRIKKNGTLCLLLEERTGVCVCVKAAAAIWMYRGVVMPGVLLFIIDGPLSRVCGVYGM